MSFDDASSCTDDTFGFNEGGLAGPCSARTTIILTDSSTSSHSNHEPTIRNGSGSGSDSDVVVEEADHTGDTTEDDQDSLNLLAFEILSVTMYEHHHTFPSGASDASDLDMGRFGEGDAAGGPRGNSDRSGTSTSHWGSDGAESRVDSDDSNTNRESEDGDDAHISSVSPVKSTEHHFCELIRRDRRSNLAFCIECGRAFGTRMLSH